MYMYNHTSIHNHTCLRPFILYIANNIIASLYRNVLERVRILEYLHIQHIRVVVCVFERRHESAGSYILSVLRHHATNRVFHLDENVFKQDAIANRIGRRAMPTDSQYPKNRETSRLDSLFIGGILCIHRYPIHRRNPIGYHRVFIDAK
jgi:hypothetical protein